MTGHNKEDNKEEKPSNFKVDGFPQLTKPSPWAREYFRVSLRDAGAWVRTVTTQTSDLRSSVHEIHTLVPG